MKRYDTERNIIGLTKQEGVVMERLNNERMTVAALSRETGIPRTTLYYILPKLRERGWLTTHQVKNRTLWTRVAKEVYVDQFDHMVQTFFSDQSKKSLRARSTDTIRFHEGFDNVFKLYNELITADPHKKKRIQTIQPTASIREGLRKARAKKFVELNTKIIENQLITEGVLPERYYRELGKEFGEKWLTSLMGRAASIHVLPEDHFPFQTEAHSVEGAFYIIDWYDETMLEIRYPALESMFTCFMNNLIFSGKKIDHEAHIKGLLAAH